MFAAILNPTAAANKALLVRKKAELARKLAEKKTPASTDNVERRSKKRKGRNNEPCDEGVQGAARTTKPLWKRGRKWNTDEPDPITRENDFDSCMKYQ